VAAAQLPSEMRQPRSWRTRPDPFAADWPGIAERLAIASTGSLVSAGSCGDAHDIVDTEFEAGSFNTLVAAVKAAGLVDALPGDNYTSPWTTATLPHP
jgi:hypothetical protein